MFFSLSIGPIVALIAGILILVLPRLLNYIIALYLIIVGIVGLFGTSAPSGPRAELQNLPPASVHQVAPTPVGPVIGI